MAVFVPLVSPPKPPRLEPEPPAISREPPIDLETERAEAHLAGRAAAMAEAQERISGLESQLAASVALHQALEAQRPDLMRMAAGEVATLVVELARRVVGDALALNPDALPFVVTQALERLPNEDELWIHVPAEAVEPTRLVVKAALRDRVVGDPLLSGCRIESRHASIEVTLVSVLAGVEAATQDWLESVR